MSTLIPFPTHCRLDQDISQRIGALADKAMALIEAKAFPSWVTDHITDELSWLLEQWSSDREGRPVHGVAVRIRLETLERLLAQVGRQEVFHCIAVDTADREGARPRSGMAWILAILICVSVFVFLFVALPLAVGADPGTRSDGITGSTVSSMAYGCAALEPPKPREMQPRNARGRSFSADSQGTLPLEMPPLGGG